MCVDDMMLANHISWDFRHYSLTGGGTADTFEYDESRVAVILFSPNQSAVKISLFDSPTVNQWFIRRSSTTSDGDQLTLRQFGSLVHQKLRVYNDSACSFTVGLGFLPKNRDMLERLTKVNP